MVVLPAGGATLILTWIPTASNEQVPAHSLQRGISSPIGRRGLLVTAANAETECLIGLGGNVGAVEVTIQTALQQLSEAGCQILRVSRLYHSDPMGPDAGQEFVNAAARIQTGMTSRHLLSILQQIEEESGRVRGVHWGPRTLDLDLLCYGQHQVSSSDLIIPHPGIWYRRFVLEPLSEIAPDWQHPGLGVSIDELRKRLEWRPLRIEVVSSELPECPQRYKGQLQLERISPEAVGNALDAGVFCRFVTEPSRQLRASNRTKFTLAVGADGLESLLSSVADAALGKCEA